MANVLFKRGLQGNLPTGASIADGTFYLTTDTQRLFVGNGTGASAKLIPLCETVQIVDNFNSLPTGANIIEGQFYYTIAENVLCIYKTDAQSGKKAWQQINPDTFISTITTAGSGSTVTTSFEDNRGLDTLSANIEFAGENVNVVASTVNDHAKVTITGDEDTLKVTNGTNEATVTLDSTLSADSSVKFAAGSGITISGAAGTNNNGTITIGTTGLGLNDNDIKDVAQRFDANGHLITTLTTNGNDTIANVDDNFTPTIKIGNTEQSVVFANGVADLNVYTIAEIDDKLNKELKALNALTYKGAVGSNGGVVGADVPTTGVHVGDVYLINGNLPQGSTLGAKHGDLVIANGTEDASTGLITSGLTWTVVPSGNETDTTYTYQFGESARTVNLFNNVTEDADGVLTIKEKDGTPLKITLVGDNQTGIGTFTVEHIASADHKATNTAGAEIKPNATANEDAIFSKTEFNAVTNVVRDAFGHVKDFTLSKVSLVDSKLSSTTTTATTAVADNVATVGVNTIAYDASGDGIAATGGEFKMTSATMEITKDVNSGAVVMNQVWGTF